MMLALLRPPASYEQRIVEVFPFKTHCCSKQSTRRTILAMIGDGCRVFNAVA